MQLQICGCRQKERTAPIHGIKRETSKVLCEGGKTSKTRDEKGERLRSEDKTRVF